MCTYVVKLPFYFTAIGLWILLSSCSGSGAGGHAPSPSVIAPTPAPVTANPDYTGSSLSSTQTKTTPQGWVVDMDQTNPIRTQLLSNGWKVEVRYE